jgi:nicotinate-nucleotide--dimethylbenzimidazole phosphoribosyltransferase
MTLSMPTFAPVPPLDATAMAQAVARQATLTKPAGALGRLEEISVWLAGAQGLCPPRAPQRIRVVLFAGDHGVAAAGVSAYPSEVTAQMVANFLAGGAGVNVLSRRVGAGVRVIDMSVATDIANDGLPADVSRWKVRRGSGRIDVEDALTPRETATAIAAGQHIADDEVDAGADLLIPGDMGIGNTTPATVLIALLTGTTAEQITGRGTGIDDETLKRKCAVVAAAMQRQRVAEITDRPLDSLTSADAAELVGAVGGADFAAMAGFLAQAAVRRTPVLLDGVVSGAAALIADRLAPGAAAWWRAGHRSTEPAHRAALTALNLEPLLDLGLRLGEGSGALASVPLLFAATDTLAGMATFGEASVSDRG